MRGGWGAAELNARRGKGGGGAAVGSTTSQREENQDFPDQNAGKGGKKESLLGKGEKNLPRSGGERGVSSVSCPSTMQKEIRFRPPPKKVSPTGEEEAEVGSEPRKEKRFIVSPKK